MEREVEEKAIEEKTKDADDYSWDVVADIIG